MSEERAAASGFAADSDNGAPPELSALVADGVAPAFLVAHLSMLLGARVPIRVAGPASAATRDLVATALLAGSSPRGGEGRRSDEAPLVSSVEAADLAALLAPARGAVRGAVANDAFRRFGVALFVGDELARHDGTGVARQRGRLLSAHLLHAPEGASSRSSAAQRPTLLATWNEGAGRWDDFAWAAIPVLAARCGATHEAYALLLAEREAVLAAHAEA